MPLMSTIVDSLSSGVIAIDCDEKIIVFNDAAARLMEISKEHVLGAKLLTVVPNSGLVNVCAPGSRKSGDRRLSATHRPRLSFPGHPRRRDDRGRLHFPGHHRNGEGVAGAGFHQDPRSDARGSPGRGRGMDGGGGCDGIVTMISEEYAEFNGLRYPRRSAGTLRK